MNPPRKYLGSRSTLVSREKVWQTADAFDVVSSQSYEIVQRSVLFEDVRLVTYHREYGKAFVLVMGMLSALMLGIAFLIGVAGSWTGAGIMAVCSAPFVIPFALRLYFRLDVITIFGRRSRASIQFPFRKARARELYGQICATVRAAQRAAAPPEASAPEDVAHHLAGGVPLPDGAHDRAADDDGVAPVA